MPSTELNGWRIAWEEAGSGPPVLLLHSVLMDHTMFSPQVEALTDRWRIVTPDARCHGASEHRGGEPFTQWDLMEDAVALLDHLGIARAVWGGVSQGTFQALRAALRHPDRVAGLILIGGSAEPEEEARAAIYEAAGQVASEEGWSEDILRSVTIAMFGESASEDLKANWMSRWKAEPSAGAYERMLAVTRRESLADRLDEIRAPAIVIHGEEDFSIAPEVGERLAFGLPDLDEFVRVPRAGHSSTIEQPDPVTEAIERFLRKAWPP